LISNGSGSSFYRDDVPKVERRTGSLQSTRPNSDPDGMKPDGNVSFAKADPRSEYNSRMADMEGQIRHLQSQLVETLGIAPGGGGPFFPNVRVGMDGQSGMPASPTLPMGDHDIPDHFSRFVAKAIAEATARIEEKMQQRIEEGLTVAKMQVQFRALPRL
jgi:hypothetical protein